MNMVSIKTPIKNIGPLKSHDSRRIPRRVSSGGLLLCVAMAAASGNGQTLSCSNNSGSIVFGSQTNISVSAQVDGACSAGGGSYGGVNIYVDNAGQEVGVCGASVNSSSFSFSCSGIPSGLKVGSYTVKADYNQGYTSCNSVTGIACGGTLTVSKATPTITAWPTASSITYGQSLASSALSGGTGSVAGTFAWTTPSTAPNAGSPSESVTFTPTDTADYNSVTGSVTVSVAKATPSGTLSCSPSSVSYVPLGSGTLTTCTATFTAPQSTANVVFTYNGGASWTTVPLNNQNASASGFAPGTSAQSFSILASFQGDGNYNPASASSTFTITKATPTGSLACSPSSVSYLPPGSGTLTTCTATFTASQSTANVVFTYNGGNSWTTVPLSNQNASANGFDPGTNPQSFSILASFQGDGNYNPASASSTFTITKATPTGSLTCSPSSVAYVPSGSGTLTTCTAAFAAPQSTANVVFTYNGGTSWTTVPLSNQNASASGFAPGTSAQSFSILASFQGDGDYNTASASSTFTITQVTPTISVSNIPSSAALGGSMTATYAYSGTGSPTESVSTSTPGVCTASGSTVSFVRPGTCTLNANATATTDYTSATGAPQSFPVAGSIGVLPTLSNITAPYAALQSPVALAGGNFSAGAVAYGPAGTPLIVTGSDLGSGGTAQFTAYYKCESGDSNCTVGTEVEGASVQAQVTSWTPNKLYLTVPSGASSGLVTVTVEGKTSNALPFIVTQGTYSASCPTFPSTTQLQITTTSLPDGVANQNYSADLDLAGGTPPYRLSITSGNLPGGLSLNQPTGNQSTGTISGTPTSAIGPLDLTVQVTDSGNPQQSDAAVLSLTIQGVQLYPATVYTYNAAYDGLGNVQNYYDSVDNGTGTIMGSWAFTYDALNRLQSGQATAGGFAGENLCWAYDSYGNRTVQSVQSTACPAQNASTWVYGSNNRVVGVIPPGGSESPSPLTYDASGNVTVDATTMNQYLYDAEGRVCAVQSPSGLGPSIVTGYVYDADGTRVAKGIIPVSAIYTSGMQPTIGCDPSTWTGFQMTESYVLGPSGEELSILDGSGNWQLTNVYAGGKLIGTYDLIPNPNAGQSGQPQQIPALHFHIEDPMGTRRMQLSGNPTYLGVPETDIQSLPYGDGLFPYADQYAPPTADDSTPLHFTGKERDTESGNDYFGARYYASTMGRFMSPDWTADPDTIPYAKLDDPQSLNLFEYAANNPSSRFDFDGHQNCTKTTLSILINGKVVSTISAVSCLQGLDHLQENAYRQAKEDLHQLSSLWNNRPHWAPFSGSCPNDPGCKNSPLVQDVMPWGPTGGLGTAIDLSLKPVVGDLKLQGILDQLYRPGDSILGGTAGAARQELATGVNVGGKSHFLKAIQMARRIEKGIESGQWVGRDLEVARAVMNDLRDAVTVK